MVVRVPHGLLLILLLSFITPSFSAKIHSLATNEIDEESFVEDVNENVDLELNTNDDFGIESAVDQDSVDAINNDVVLDSEAVEEVVEFPPSASGESVMRVAVVPGKPRFDNPILRKVGTPVKPKANVFQKGFQELQNAAKPLTDAVQPVVNAVNRGFSTEGFEETADAFLSGANDVVAPIVGFGTKVAKPFVKVGSKVTAPFVKVGSKVAAPFVKLGAKVVAPFAKFGAHVAKVKSVKAGLKLGLKAKKHEKFRKVKSIVLKPVAKATSIVAGGSSIVGAAPALPVVDEVFSNSILVGNSPRPVDVTEEIIEVIDDQDPLQPIVESLKPLSKASRPLVDAVQPIADAFSVQEPVTFTEISEDAAAILRPIVNVASPVVDVKSKVTAPFVALGAKKIAPIVKIGTKLVKKTVAAVTVPVVKAVKKVAAVGAAGKNSFDSSSFNTGINGGIQFGKAPGGPIKFDFGVGGGSSASFGGFKNPFASTVEEIEIEEIEEVEDEGREPSLS